MTLVPNRLRQLNGNKGFVFVIALLCLLSSCGSAKKAKQTQTTVPIATKVDTIKWVEDDYGAPPITSDGIVYEEEQKEKENDDSRNEIPTSERLNSYNIQCLFPFYAAQFSPGNAKSKEKSQRAISLFAGMKMAADKLSSENINLNINVLDSNGAEENVKSSLSSTEFQNADLVIGPFKKRNVKAAADWCANKKIPFVSPMNPSDDLASGNPYFVQVKPSLENHCKAITEHALNLFSPDEIVLVCRNKSAETARFAFFNTARRAFFKGQDNEKFREYVVSDYGNNFTNMDFSSYFPLPDDNGVISEKVSRVFIIPSWSSEAFVNSALRLIRIAKQHHDVYVYGMPRWKTYEKVDFEYYESLNLHISSDGFVDPTGMDAKSFKSSFFYKFGELPSDDAYFGYDLLLYFGRMLDKHGTQFQNKIDVEPYNGLHSSFDFLPVGSGNIESPGAQYLINQHVDIIKFKDFYFQSAN